MPSKAGSPEGPSCISLPVDSGRGPVDALVIYHEKVGRVASLLGEVRSCPLEQIRIGQHIDSSQRQLPGRDPARLR